MDDTSTNGCGASRIIGTIDVLSRRCCRVSRELALQTLLKRKTPEFTGTFEANSGQRALRWLDLLTTLNVFLRVYQHEYLADLPVKVHLITSTNLVVPLRP